jgi:CMP-N-acetylneuraminic acid synthetase
MKEQWKRYMNLDSRFECYFYKANLGIATPYELSGNLLQIKQSENRNLILEKTFKALEYFRPRFHEFDFISRPNMSTFFLFDRYVSYLETLPKGPIAEGVRIYAHNYEYPSGCGFTVSSEAAELILEGRNQGQFIMDDVTIGKICKEKKIPFRWRQFYEVKGSSIEKSIEDIRNNPKIFHLRFKTNDRKQDIVNYTTIVDKYIGSCIYNEPTPNKIEIEQKILCVIPARSGSKGLPGKNIKNFRGRPLFAWSIMHAQRTKYPIKIIVSTDSEEYATLAKRFGAEAPFLRPAEISGDSSTDLECMKHAVEWLKENESYTPDIIVQLRPTYPTRTSQFLEECITKFLEVRETHDSLRTVVPVAACPFKMYTVEEGCLNPLFKTYGNGAEGMVEPYNQCRQAFPQVYAHNGCIDIFNTSILEKGVISGDIIYPMIMSEKETYDIDTEADFKAAENMGFK